ncbi:MAG: hypothetical protein MJH10_20130, partial [Epibacterium sp.]|nr:hypothetical protein [Epibacterium sp.]NQX75783.1 hypothetical protein [Epibacterium sp.]
MTGSIWGKTLEKTTRYRIGHWISTRLGRVLQHLWSVWSGLAAISLLAALWQAGHELYGPFILTSPLETLLALRQLLYEPAAWDLALLSLQRAISGFAFVATAGTVLGVAAGYAPAAMRLAQPLITVLLGVPPIA